MLLNFIKNQIQEISPLENIRSLNRNIRGDILSGITVAIIALPLALAFGEIAREANLPRGALNIVPGLGSEAGHALASNRGIAHISFTGSAKTGTLVQSRCGCSPAPPSLLGYSCLA